MYVHLKMPCNFLYLFYSFLGYPLPRLAWFSIQNERQQIMDATFEFNDNSTINTLFIKTLDRTNFGQTFTCMASNNNATLPVATNVTIDMRRKFFE